MIEMGADQTNKVMGKGPVTNCVRCDSWTHGPGPALCANCQAEGYKLCAHCHQRVSNQTTPYCDQCAEEIVGGG
jgi:hypothetical protein